MVKAVALGAKRNIGGAKMELSAGRLGAPNPNWAVNRFGNRTISILGHGSHAGSRSFASKLKHEPCERHKRCRLEPGFDRGG
jgi:hypothetical protein